MRLRSSGPERFSPAALIAFYVTLGIFLVWLLFPIYWMIVTSFKPDNLIIRIPPGWLPTAYLGQYQRIFRTLHFAVFLGNNFWVAGWATFITMLAAILAGYGLSRYRTVLGTVLLYGLLSTQMFPVIGIVISLYALYIRVGMLDTHTGLILVLAATAVPFSTLLMKGFFDDMPKSMEESARVDGAGRITILFRIVLPLSKPGLLASGLFAFMLAWDDFLFALTLIRSEFLRTLSVGISMRYVGQIGFEWGRIATASFLGALPMFILFFIFQAYLVQGLTAGAVKG